MKKKNAAHTAEPHNWTHDGDKVLILKRINTDRTSYNCFKWPESGTVECPDWEPSKSCGQGLHGWPWGMGLGEGHDFDILNDIWLVLSASPDDIIGELEQGWKCKAKTVEVVFSGAFHEAFSLIKEGRAALIKALAASGNDSNLAASGDFSKLAASGNSSNLAASGNYSNLAASGNYSNLAASGNSSKLAASGNSSIAAGIADRCQVSAGENGCLVAAWHDGDRPRVSVAYVGENGIKADTYYCVNGSGEFVEADS